MLKPFSLQIMTNFSFVNDLNHLLKMDDPVTKGPMPRWQKKGLEMSNSR